MNTEEKKALRRRMRQEKAALTDGQKHEQAARVFRIIESMPEFERAQSVLLYYSLPDELPTHEVVDRWHKQGKTVFLPRMTGNDLEIVAYDGRLSSDNAFGVEEPVGEADDRLPDIIIVPGVAFDNRCNRLGRGRGFYDHLLARCQSSLKIGVALDCQIVDRVPTEPHDIALDRVVAPESTFSRT